MRVPKHLVGSPFSLVEDEDGTKIVSGGLSFPFQDKTVGCDGINGYAQPHNIDKGRRIGSIVDSIDDQKSAAHQIEQLVSGAVTGDSSG